MLDISHNSQQITFEPLQKSHNETETRIDDILIRNNVQQNCYQGTLGTDRASWTTGSAKLLGKDLMYCTRHESEYIMSAGAGLSGRSQNLFMAEMNAMLYDITSKEELASRFVKAYQDYGHHSPARAYIDILVKLKEKLCKAYTQDLFTLLHTTTQRSEGKNASIKGSNTDLKAYLSNADLVTLHERLSLVNLFDDLRALKQLEDLRVKNKRVSSYYEAHVRKSKELAMDKIQGECEKLGNDLYRVNRFDKTSHIVNLKTKIVHRGRAYVLPTCNCGFWRSSFIPCMCIIKVFNACGKDISKVENVHPYHLIEMHPLWPEALKQLKRDNYDDAIIPITRGMSITLINNSCSH